MRDIQEAILEVFEMTNLMEYLSQMMEQEAQEDQPAQTYYHLRPIQRWLLDSHFTKARSTMMNMGTLAMLAMAKSSGRREAIMSWVHHGRVTLNEQRMVGLMLGQLPIRWDFSPDETIHDVLLGVEARIKEGLQHRSGLKEVYDRGLQDQCVSGLI